MSSILLPSAATNTPNAAPAVPAAINSPARDPANATIFVNPYATNNTGLTIGEPFSVSINMINMTNVPLINVFVMSLSYDPSIIDALSVSYTGGLFSNSPIVALYCIDGTGQNPGGTGCPSTGQGRGIINYSLGLLGNTTSASGTLFSVNFQVTGKGLSPIHFLSVSMAVNGVAVSAPLSIDGYFTNKNCFDNRLCTPPVGVVHVVSPASKIGAPITLNATGSHGTNGPRDNITSYSWDWGDGNIPTPSPNPVDTHTYTSPFNYTVTLTVTDSYNAPGFASVTLRIVRFRIDLSAHFQSLSRQVWYPGDQILLRALVQNLGTNTSTSMFRFLVENRTLNEVQLPLLPPTGQISESVTWNTTGLMPQSYTIVAEVDPVTAVINGKILVVENDTLNDIDYLFIVLIEPITPGYGIFLGLGLLQTGALGIIVFGGVVGAVSAFLRRRKRPMEEVI